MTRDPITVTPDDTLAHALRLTRTHRIRHLPVCGAGGTLLGILSDRDIRLAMPSPLTVEDAERMEFLERTPVAAVMSREVVTVQPSDTVENAARLLYMHRVGAVPVVDERGRLSGILSETDILYAFVQMLGGAAAAARIEVLLEDRPGQLAQAVRVVGEQLRLNIVSIVVPSTRLEGRTTAILHVETADPGAAIGALELAGFRVGSPALDDDVGPQDG